MQKTVIIFLVIIFSGSALAQERNINGAETFNKPFSLIGTMGISFGGDEFPSDEEDDEGHISAGEAFAWKLGVVLQPHMLPPQWEIQVALGWKMEGEYEDDTDGIFSRYPIDIMGYYKFNKLRCGAGLTYHLNPKYEGNNVPSNVDGDFDNALGLILGLDYQIGNHFLVGTNYEIIAYESATDTFNGNNLSISLGLRF
ncbi:MAG: outer membrane beta-barrel protein [Desulfobacteraceae bacterium]|jgi:hypothetical protein